MASKAKKTAALLLAALMCAGAFAGCNPTSSDNPSSTGGASNTGSVASTTTNASRPSVEQMTAKIKEEAQNGKIELKVWAPGGDKKFVKSALEDFKNDYKADGVQYTFKVLEVGENDAVGKLTEDPSKGADVFQFPTDTLLKAKQSKAVAEVPPLLQPQITEDNMPEAVEATKVDGKIYAYPMTSDNGYILFYDKATYTEDDVKSFESLLDKSKEKKTTVLMSIDNAWYNAGFFYAAGCDIKLDSNTNKMDLIDFDGDKGVAAVKAMKSLVDNYSGTFIGSGDDAAISTLLSDGKLKAVVTGTWNTTAFQETWGKDNVGAVKLPTVKMNGTDTQVHSFGGYKLIGVNAQSKYPTTAAIVASYLTGEKVQEKRYAERNLIPTNNVVREKDEVKNNPIVKAIDAQKEFAHPQSVCTQAFWDPIASIGTDLNNGNLKSDADIKAALATQVKSVENGK